LIRPGCFRVGFDKLFVGKERARDTLRMTFAAFLDSLSMLSGKGVPIFVAKKIMLHIIIFLSLLLSIGILSSILACALFNNYLPLLSLGILLLAPIPNIICSRLNSGGYSDEANGLLEGGYFVSSFLIGSGVVSKGN
jgi:hypothetical protein